MTAALPILDARDLVVLLGGQKRWLRPEVRPVRAVAGVSLALAAGETLGLVGESGCGKTTLGRTLLGIQRETEGEIRLDGRRVSGLAPREARAARRAVQYVHQDAGAALDPWWSIGRILEEGLIVHGVGDGAARAKKIDGILAAVGLDGTFKPRYVHELSGGQLRRVALARILLLEPRVVILDEPTSGLDLSVVERMCESVAIMYLGRIVEAGPAGAVFATPLHPYTRALLAAAPRLEPGRRLGGGILEGDPPSPRNLPSGCAFRTRCPHATSVCAGTVPPLEPAGSGHDVACLRWREIARDTSTVAEKHA